jgi:hypothetical protein
MLDRSAAGLEVLHRHITISILKFIESHFGG